MLNKSELKNDVLTANTAQTVFKYLQEQESNRARMHTRWIWELLQNARDASSGGTHLIASIEYRQGELAFQHNGRGFTQKEIAHLIFHGSTKTEEDEPIGKFGSGFLTTHLLSPEINVSGQLDDGQPFDFRLKREPVSVAALRKSMDESLDEFYDSLSSSTESLSDNFTTRFQYPVGDNAADAVEEGIATLKLYAPFAVVFNQEFSSIHVESSDETLTFEVVSRSPLNQEVLQEITVAERKNGTPRERKYLLAEGEKASVAIPLQSVGDGRDCVTLGDTPRLFLGFPLIGTENFSFPAVINSFKFTPTEDRDGVFLGQSENQANSENQSVIEEACELHVKLVQFMAKTGGRNIHTLVDIPKIPEAKWLNKKWIGERLREFIERIRQTPAVLCGHEPITPKGSVLPFAVEDASVEPLWDLVSEVKEFRQRLPKKDEAIGWCRAIKSWAEVHGCAPTSYDEAFDGSLLASHIEKRDTLDSVRTMLSGDVCEVEWLNRVYKFLLNNKFDDKIRGCRFVLNQACNLDELSNLYRDSGVDDELKDVSDDLLSLEIREKLRDNRLTSLTNEVGKGDFENKDVIKEIIDELKSLTDDNNLNDEFAEASARLLAWIVSSQEWSYLSDFHAFSLKPDNGKREVLLLRKNNSGDDPDIPLAPVKAWPEDLQPFAELFPWQHILADSFFEAVSDPDAWRMLEEQRFVRTDVLITSDRNFGDFLPDESLLEPDVVHRTDHAVTVTDIVYLSKDDIGIMDRVRQSRRLAHIFWRFLTEWLVEHDSEGLDARKAPCEGCEETHQYFQAAWLVPLVKNRWVPLGSRKTARADAQSLANLLRDSGWKPGSLSESPATAKLLKAIRVTRFDLTREFIVEDNEEDRAALDATLTDILVSTGGDLGQVRQFVEDMEKDKDLLHDLTKRREQRRIVHENQELGRRIEDLVRESLEGEGFIVERTGIGSDFVIEHDLIEEDREMGFQVSLNDRNWLVEVKATRDQSARMTVTQAKTAVKEGDGFLLCVVPVGVDNTDLEKDRICANMRFVQNIGPRLESLCEKLNTFADLRNEAIARSETTDIQLEIESGTARIRVDDTVWLDGICLKDLSKRLFRPYTDSCR